MIFIKFKELADEKFNCKYSYVESSFEGRFVDIICKEHGRFRKDIHSHLSGVGCKKCNSFKVKIIENAKLFVDKNAGYKFIGLETVKRKTYMKFECPKGHSLKFMRGCEKTCFKCSRLAERKKKLQILADENDTKVSIGDCSITTICPTHGENTVSFNSFKRSKKCKNIFSTNDVVGALYKPVRACPSEISNNDLGVVYV